jgi:hypothetical protein
MAGDDGSSQARRGCGTGRRQRTPGHLVSGSQLPETRRTQSVRVGRARAKSRRRLRRNGGQAPRRKRHPTPHSESEVPSARPRRRGVPIDECRRHARPKDGVPREEFVVTDRLNRLPRLEHPFMASPRKRRRGIVIRTDERAEMHEHVVTPDIIRETEIEPAPWSGMKRSPSPTSPSMEVRTSRPWSSKPNARGAAANPSHSRCPSRSRTAEDHE